MGDLWGLGRRGYPGSSEEDRNRDAAPGESVCGGLGAARGLGVPLPREERLRSLETRVRAQPLCQSYLKIHGIAGGGRAKYSP